MQVQRPAHSAPPFLHRSFLARVQEEPPSGKMSRRMLGGTRDYAQQEASPIGGAERLECGRCRRVATPQAPKGVVIRTVRCTQQCYRCPPLEPRTAKR